MDISYRREMRHNYLIIVPDTANPICYESRMLEQNAIRGLLPFRSSQCDGKTSFYYEITSRQPLSRMLETCPVTISELRSLILGIAGVLEQIEEYLLPEQQILLEPDYIYVEPESFEICLCMIPGSDQDFPLKLEGLLQYLLTCVDHQDKECVVLAYGLYQESQKENYGVTDLLRLLPGHREEAAEPHREEVVMEEAGIYQEVSKPPELKRPWRKRFRQAVEQISGKTKGQFEDTNLSEWQELLEESDLNATDSGIANRKTKSVREAVPAQEPVTVLLTDSREENRCYYLRALMPELADIPLTGFPFLIGKQSNLADYHLEKETISRLHVKIEEREGGFVITDLNSTNGTKVRGINLENNGHAVLSCGDEIQIAEWKYRFELK